jgi:hypothetical protein
MADRPYMAMNGVARTYWAEILDLRLPVEDERGKPVKVRRKKLLRTVTSSPQARRAAS